MSKLTWIIILVFFISSCHSAIPLSANNNDNGQSSQPISTVVSDATEGLPTVINITSFDMDKQKFEVKSNSNKLILGEQYGLIKVRQVGNLSASYPTTVVISRDDTIIKSWGSSGSYDVLWDGRDYNDNIVEAGTYTIHLFRNGSFQAKFVPVWLAVLIADNLPEIMLVARALGLRLAPVIAPFTYRLSEYILRYQQPLINAILSTQPSTRQLLASDLELVPEDFALLNNGQRALLGTIEIHRKYMIVTVNYIEAATGRLPNGLPGAMTGLINTARSLGMVLVRVQGTFARPEYMNKVVGLGYKVYTADSSGGSLSLSENNFFYLVVKWSGGF